MTRFYPPIIARSRPPQSHARQASRAALLLGALALGACTQSPEDERAEPAPQSLTAAATVTTAAAESPRPELELSGEIAADGNRMARVFPRMGGQVLRVGADLGDEVRAGQVLAVLSSGEMADLQNQRTSSSADLTVARKNLAVARELFQDGIGAEQDVYKAEKEVARATGNTNRNERQLSMYHQAADGHYELRAPVAGFITEKHLAAGMHFNPSQLQSAFTIVGLDSVWVMANVFEADLDQVRRGQPVEITTLSYPGQPLRGRIDQVFNLLDPASKVLKVRCTLANPGHLLKPGMHAQVRMLAAQPTPAFRPTETPSQP
ncbi:MAG: efflux RND transporter periplasmic adaptor subunit [Bacteroidota bacterium]|nr:efflux RND transporter periplasmic adaptor subunit [Bacteroidota bacterium]